MNLKLWEKVYPSKSLVIHVAWMVKPKCALPAYLTLKKLLSWHLLVIFVGPEVLRSKLEGKLLNKDAKFRLMSAILKISRGMFLNPILLN